MAINKYSVVESGNVGLGQAGCLYEDTTDAVTGENIVAIQCLAETKFTTLTPQTDKFIGTAGGKGQAIIATDAFPAGTFIFGRWSGFALASGTVVAYLG
jgi:hypothetical protein